MLSNHLSLSCSESQPESPQLACEKESVDAYVGVCTFRYVLFCFWHTFVVLCKPTVIPPTFTMSPFSNMTHGLDQWQSHSMLLLPCWLGEWLMTVVLLLPLLLGFYPSSYQLWVWTHCLLAQWEAQIAAPEPGESLTPPLTNSDLSSTSREPDWWCHVMQLQPEIRNKKARHMWT